MDNPGERPENTLTRSVCELNVQRLWPELVAAQSAEPALFVELAHRIQAACGCAHGRPCYWSTYGSLTCGINIRECGVLTLSLSLSLAPTALMVGLLSNRAASWTHTGQDCIEYTMQRNAIVSSVAVTPYRVFWYPGSPTYSPLQLSFSLHELLEDRDGDGDEQDGRALEVGPAVFESPVYDAISDMKVCDSVVVLLSAGVALALRV